MSKRFAGVSAVLAGVSAVCLAHVYRQRRARAGSALLGQVFLITGGSRGLGFAIATEVASQGAKVILTSRNLPELERARDRLVERGIDPANLFIQAADVTRPENMRTVVEAGTNRFGLIDVLINNAGVIMVGPVEDHTVESFQLAMNVNFYGALYATLAILPQMMARGDGAIVNIASIGGKVAFPHLLPYVASKFALVGWSQGLHAELASRNIRVTTVAPGILRTGSHIQAQYTGNTEQEYRWFASAASLPVTATNASVAARKIVRALRCGSAEISIGLQAIVAGRFANLAPELTAGLLSTANSLLPDAPDDHREDAANSFWQNDRSIPGKVHRGSLPGLFEWFGEKAIKRYNQ